MLYDISSFPLSGLIATMLLASIPWEYLELFQRSFFENYLKGNFRSLSSFPMGNMFCGAIFGALMRLNQIPAHQWLILFYILVAFNMVLPWRKFSWIQSVPIACFSFLFATPLEWFAGLPLIATILITFGPVIFISLFSLILSTLLLCLPGNILDPFVTLGYVLFLIICITRDGRILSLEISIARDKLKEHLVRRKIYRYCGLLFPLVIYPVYGLGIFRIVLCSTAITALFIEGARKVIPGLNNILKKVFSPVGKKEEAFHISGTTTYLAGSATASLFPGAAGPLSIIMLTLGDAWAVLAGSRWGKHHWMPGKTIEGSLACLFISFLSGLSFVLYFSEIRIFWPVILISAIALTLAEGLTRGKWDNLVLAPVAAFVIWIFI